MNGGVIIQHKVADGAFQPGAEAAIECETRAGNLTGGLRIQDIKRRAEIPVCFGLKIELCRLSETADLLIETVVFAVGDQRIRDIRYSQHYAFHTGIDILDLRVKIFYFVSNFLHFRHQLGNVFAFFFIARNQL